MLYGNGFYLLRIFLNYSFVLTLLYRQDLANLVRRRGYKLIKELLAASQEVKVNDFNVDESLTDNQENTNTEEDESTGVFFFFSLFTTWNKVKLKTLLIK